MLRELTCIVCPMGCQLKAEITDNKIVNVSGNTCPRGKQYAINECTDPQRTVTTTMRCAGGVVSVKTDRTISKDKIFECMKIINSHFAPLPIHVGDVIIEKACGANIVATQNKEEAV